MLKKACNKKCTVSKHVDTKKGDTSKIESDDIALKQARSRLLSLLWKDIKIDDSIDDSVSYLDYNLPSSYENAKIVRNCLKSRKVDFTEAECSDSITFQGLVCTNGEIIDVFNWRIIVEDDSIHSLFALPTHVSKKKRIRIAEYLSLVNYSLIFGKLIMSPDDGELVFQMAVPATIIVGNVNDEIDRILKIPAIMLERYAPGIFAVLMGMSPSKAFAMCENLDTDKDDEEGSSKGWFDDISNSDGVGAVAMQELEASHRHQSCPSSYHNKGDVVAVVDKNYSLEGLNVVDGVPLEKVVLAVKKFREGKEHGEDIPRMNILLSGPPGCGKTAFVNYLSNVIQVPLITVSASDILSSLVGGTEQKIASYFNRAKETNSILFLDEIDALLLNRETAIRSYEMSQTTELMLQMEKFGGVMIGATNFESHLDGAVLRRFTLKIKMGYLTNSAKVAFFERFFKTSLNETERDRLNGIELSPGDYRSARQRLFYTCDNPNNDERLAALEFEAAARGNKPSTIGF